MLTLSFFQKLFRFLFILGKALVLGIWNLSDTGEFTGHSLNFDI